MNVSGLAIRRPVATLLLTIAIALAGVLAFQVLPVAPLPQIDSPALFVEASLPGASPEVMAAAVATPLERQLSHIAGITEMTSESSTGQTSISMQFELERDINGAAREVQAAISAARSYLPANMPQAPQYWKANPADPPIMILGLTSKNTARSALYDRASTVLTQQLAQLPGVGKVFCGGSSLPAVRVEVNPRQLEHYGVKLADVATFLKNQNARTPTGSVSDDQTTSFVLVDDQLTKAEQYRQLVIPNRNNAPIRLQDVADVVDSTEDTRAIGYLNGEPAVLIMIFKKPGSNVIETVERIKTLLPQMRAGLPAGYELQVALDRTTTIRASLRDVEGTLVLSIVLVVAVVFVFLRSGRATLIPGIAVPVSLAGTFAVMHGLGYSLDNLSLMALTISTGFVVDDAIVVMENITRHVETGMPAREAALVGAREIAFTVLSITFSLVAVFLPILLLDGMVGRLFREMAVTLSAAILVSMVLSLSTTPMLCALLLKPAHEPGRLYRISEAAFERLVRAYERSLRAVLGHPRLVLLLFLCTIGLNVFYVVRLPTGFFPQQDNGVVFGGLQGSQDASFKKMDEALKRAMTILREDPAIATVVGFTGGEGSVNSAFVFLDLKPRAERKESSSEIVDRLRPKLAEIHEAQTFVMAGQDLRTGGRKSNSQFQYQLLADSVEELRTWAPVLTARLKKLPALVDVSSDLQAGGLQTYLTYDRTTASRLGITPSDINGTLTWQFAQAQASTIYRERNQYHVVLEADPSFTQDPHALDGTSVSTSAGLVPLAAVTHAYTRTAPLSVNHTGLFPSSTLAFNLAPGVTLGEATEKIRAIEDELGMPKTVRGEFAGTAQQFQKSMSSEPVLLVTALVAVYILLGILYESFLHPLTILTTLPSASLGAILTLHLFDAQLDVIALIGILLLIGIVKKNAIMMIDFALQLEREQGMGSEEAIFNASVLRFRPILMTSAAALFGALPLAFGHGIGSELRRPLGLTIIGGLLVSQVLTLYSTPVIYLMVDRLRLRFARTAR